MVSLSPFFQTAVIGWGEAGKQNHWEKARPVKGLTRGNGAGAVNPGSLCMDPAERAKLRLFCSLPAVLGSRWTSCLAGWKRRDHAQAGRVHRVLRSGDLSGPVSAAGEASSARGGSFFAAACLALLLPGLWRKRVLLVGTGLALALGWNWLYSYAVRAPLRPCPAARAPLP